jgi:D-alanyl-D-alanine carboxypeptidase
MRSAARRASIELRLVSAYRDCETQRQVYLAKLERSGWNQRTVAKPGHSEHQLGTAIDLVGDDAAALLEEFFVSTPAGLWLREHAPDFGFSLSYTRANRLRTGYAAEPWHYRYVGAAKARTRHEAALRRD